MSRLITSCLFIILLTSCGKDASTEYEVSRNQILGPWQFTENIQVEDIGQVGLNPIDRTGTITFFNDGTGQKEDIFFGTSNFEWIYQLSPEKISIVSNPEDFQGFINFGESKLFEILVNTSEAQQWIAEDNTALLIDSIVQLAARETSWELTR